MVSITATVVTLIVGAELWEPMVNRAVRKQAALESDEAVREAAYVQHSDDQNDIDKAA